METTQAEVIEITLEGKIETALVRHNVTDAVIAELKSKYGDMKLRSLDDKEMYLEIKGAKKVVSKVRTTAVSVCTDGREDAVKTQKLWVSKQKEVVGKIAEVEDPLDAEIKKYDDEQERIKNEEKQRQEDAYMQRSQALTRMGAVYANNTYMLGDFSMEANLVKETSQEVWEEKMLPSFTAEYQKIEAERIEQERIKAEQQAEVRRQQQELERQQAELKAQQEAFRKQQEEAERAQKERLLAVQKERMELNGKRLQLLAPFNPYSKGVDTSTLWELSEEAFIALVDEVKLRHEQELAEQKKRMEEEVAAKERAKMEEEQRMAEVKRQQEAQRQAEELAKAGDKAQWEYFIAQIGNIKMPNTKSGQYRKVAAIAKEKLEEILALKP